jgi:hypothetical protein
LIGRFKRALHERHAKKQKESSQDRAARLTAHATIAIAAFTAVAAGVGLAQWWILSGQLEQMREDSRLAARAFVNVERLADPEQTIFPKASNWPDEDVFWTFRPIFSNNGKTPAVNIRVLAVTPDSEPAFYGITETVHETNFHPISKRDYDRRAPNDPEIIFSWPKDRQEQFRINDFVYLGGGAAITPEGAVFTEWRRLQFQTWMWWF